MKIAILRSAIVGCLGIVCGSVTSYSAEVTPPPEVSEAHEALAFYEGTWTKPDKNDGYKETCAWLDSRRRHMVCRASRPTPTGLREAIGIYSYDEESRQYLSHGFSGSGAILIEKGQRIPNGFRFMSESGKGADLVRTQFTIVEVGGGRVNTVTETAKPGEPWVVTDRTSYLHTRP